MKKHSPNFILASLTDQAHHCISRYLSKVEYPAQHVLYEDGEVIPYVYFPLRGVISLVKASADEQTVETGIIGSEGLVGLPIVFGIQRAANRATVQFDCECERLPTQVFLQALAQHSAMKQLVLRYA